MNDDQKPDKGRKQSTFVECRAQSARDTHCTDLARHLASIEGANAVCIALDDNLQRLKQQGDHLLFNVLSIAKEMSPERSAAIVDDDKRISLRASELVCLLVGRAYARCNEPFGYAEVTDFSLEHMSKALAEGTTHKCFSALLELNLIEPEPRPRLTSAGRPRQLYSITPRGSVALDLSIATAMHLAQGRSQVAA